jgi:hypothetical protein
MEREGWLFAEEFADDVDKRSLSGIVAPYDYSRDRVKPKFNIMQQPEIADRDAFNVHYCLPSGNNLEPNTASLMPSTHPSQANAASASAGQSLLLGLAALCNASSSYRLGGIDLPVSKEYT